MAELSFKDNLTLNSSINNERTVNFITGSTLKAALNGSTIIAIEAGIGLTATVNNFELKFDYDTALRSENNTQAVNLKAIYHF